MGESQNRHLQLQRPLAFIDLESTGLDTRTARIVRLTVLTLSTDGSEESKSALINPGVSIPPGATAVHGISDEDVADSPPFKAYASALADSLEGCDLAGYGIERFDLPLLIAEFRRAGIDFALEGRAIVDAMAVFHKLEARDLSAAHARYVGDELPTDRAAFDPARAALDVLRGQLNEAPELPDDPAAISAWVLGIDDNAVDPEGKFIWSEAGEALVNFGRHRGERVAEVALQDGGYLEWVASNMEFNEKAREVAALALSGETPTRDDDVD